MKTAMQEMADSMLARIAELNAADASFCNDRWDMSKDYLIRSIAREESNKVTFTRQELESQLKTVFALIEKEKQQIIDAYHINPKESIFGNIGLDYYNSTYPNERS